MAQITDLDGNMLEARFNRRNSAPLLSNASTAKEARRVLEWQRDVAKSLSDGASICVFVQPCPQSSRRKYARPHPVIRIVIQSHAYNVARQSQLRTTSLKSNKSEAGSSLLSGMSNQALIGTLLGAAAGAAARVCDGTIGRSQSLVTLPDQNLCHLILVHLLVSPKAQEVEQTIEAAPAVSGVASGKPGQESRGTEACGKV